MIDWEEIKTYPEMNKQVKEFLELEASFMTLYARKYIDDLEKEIERLKNIDHEN